MTEKQKAALALGQQTPKSGKWYAAMARYHATKTLSDKQLAMLDRGRIKGNAIARAPAARAKAAETNRARWASGRAKHTATHEELVARGRLGPLAVDRAKQLAANRRLGELHRGVPMPKGSRAEAGPRHWKAKYWAVRNAAGVVIEGKNLNDLIRRHAHMFEPGDLQWKRSRCRASHGIRQLYERRPNAPCSWKGWTVAATNLVSPAGRDLLLRD